MRKRLTALLLSLFMLCAYMPSVAQSDAVVSLSAETAYAGKTVDVELNLSGCDGFVNLGVEISYDNSVMTLVSVKENEVADAVFTASEYLEKIPYNIGWDSAENTYFNGTLATLTFTIADDAKPASYPIELSYYKGRDGDYVDGTSVNYDENDTPLNLSYTNGVVNVLYQPFEMPEQADWNTYNGNVYMVLDRNTSWKEAKKQCEDAGGHLAAITSQKENDFVQALCEYANDGLYYLGADNTFNEGIWSWVSNESFVYTNWSDGESTDAAANAGLAMDSQSGKWKSVAEDEEYITGFVCEWEGDGNAVDSTYWVEFESQKSIYATGEDFEVDVWLYANDSVVKVYDYEITGFDSSKSGTYNVTVSYGEYSHTFEAEVRDDITAEVVVNRVVKAEAHNGAAITPHGYSEVKDGTVMKFGVSTQEGYVIDSVYINGEAIKLTDGNLSITVDRDTVVEAYGKKKFFSISKSVNGNGYIELSSDNVGYGDSCTARFVADKGYIISDVKIDGKSIGVCKLHTFSNVRENHTVEVIFEKLVESLTVKTSSGNGGKILPARSVVNKGADAIFTVTADYGYHFAYALANGKRINSSSNIITLDNLGENTDVYAVFEKNIYSVSASDTQRAHLSVNYNGQSATRADVPFMDTAEIEVEVDEGYKLNTLYVNGKPVKPSKSGGRLTYTMPITSNTVVSARCEPTRESEFSREVASFGPAAEINESNAYSKKDDFKRLSDKYATLSDEEKKGCSSAYATILAALDRANAYIALIESGITSSVPELPLPDATGNYGEWKTEIDAAFAKYEKLTPLSRSLIDIELVKKLTALKETSEEHDKAIKGEVQYFYELMDSVRDYDDLSDAHSKLLMAENTYNNMSDETKAQVSDERFTRLISERGRISTGIKRQYVAPFEGSVLRCLGVNVDDSIEEAEEKRVIIYELMNKYHSLPSFIQEMVLPSTLQRLNALYESASIKVSTTVNNLPVDMNGDFDENMELVLTEPELDSDVVSDATGKALYQAIDVKMYSENEEVQPSSKIRIKMEISRELSYADVDVVYIDDCNMVYDVQGEVIEENGKFYIVFFVDHFSNFAVVYNESEENNISISFGTEYAEIGDTITATATGVTNIAALNLFVAGYSKSGALTFAEKGSKSVSATIAEDTVIVKAMLWDKNMSPMVVPEILDVYSEEEENDIVLNFNTESARIGDTVTATATGGTNASDYTLYVAGYSSSGALTIIEKGTGSVSITIPQNTKSVKAMIWDNNFAPVAKPESLDVSPKNDISFSTEYGKVGDTVTATVNGDINASDCSLYVTGYSGSGALTFVEKGGLTTTATISKDTVTVKAMLWDNNLTPLCVSKSFPVAK